MGRRRFVGAVEDATLAIAAIGATANEIEFLFPTSYVATEPEAGVAFATVDSRFGVKAAQSGVALTLSLRRFSVSGGEGRWEAWGGHLQSLVDTAPQIDSTMASLYSGSVWLDSIGRLPTHVNSFPAHFSVKSHRFLQHGHYRVFTLGPRALDNIVVQPRANENPVE